MKITEKFFDSTRGRIVALLRGKTGTVNELAHQLSLTDNAVRAHLLSLERDRLVRRSGLRRGHRKPHFSYELTEESERLFPKAYDTLLNGLITVLKRKFSRKELKNALRQVGISLADGEKSARLDENLESRAERALEVLNILGGAAEIAKENDKVIVQSKSCPLAAVVAEHSEACQIAEALVAEITGAKVTEQCEKTPFPRCRFEISEV
ncbi:MAG: helix-turn-helix transcriptional regulator [Pyrinomonadaceae bacterium]